MTLIPLKTLLALLWMAVPAKLLLTSLWAIVRRARLHREPLSVLGIITEVETSVDGTLAFLQLRYWVNGVQYVHATTRADNQNMSYSVGGTIELVCKEDDPANVMDATKRPWDDVIGPAVLAGLLAFFMAWLWQVFVGF